MLKPIFKYNRIKLIYSSISFDKIANDNTSCLRDHGNIIIFIKYLLVSKSFDDDYKIVTPKKIFVLAQNKR